jgi:hypothetical protein
MHPEFEKLTALAYSDGVLTEEEKSLLIKKAEQLGIDEIEAELFIANYQMAEIETPKSSPSDKYDISNEDLLQRLLRYSLHLNSAKAEIQMDPFPMIIESTNKLAKGISSGRKALAGALKTDILSDSLSVAGKFAPIPGGKIGGKLVGKGISALAKKVVGAETKTLNQTEVIALVESYLVILEMRKDQSELLSQKHGDFSRQVNVAKENPIKKKGFFG